MDVPTVTLSLPFETPCFKAITCYHFGFLEPNVTKHLGYLLEM